MPVISAPNIKDTQKLLDIAVSTGLFSPEEAEGLLGQILSDFFSQKLGEGHNIFVVYHPEAGKPAGWTYFAPTPHTQGVYDVWWIGISKEQHGHGLGTELLNFVESDIRTEDPSARLIIIETSSLPALAPTRAFYQKRGYKKCGEIAHFYDVEDNKIIFAKNLRQ
eukprot:jgi/Botrbrau1/15527/Bobra.0123s0003.1